jgi:radical SAM superfamily enzyme YgiQ (UPF0313 family)
MRFRELREQRLSAEVGTLFKEADRKVALCYPSPYRVGMSSLGFQTIYRGLNALPGVSAERAFLPDDVPAAKASREMLCTYETGRPVGDHEIVAFSLAYELELAGLADCLDLAGIPVLAVDRRNSSRPWPLIVIGGPLTFSNPVPAGPIADVIVMGEAEQLLSPIIEGLEVGGNRDALLATLARTPGYYIPSIHGEVATAVFKTDDDNLPAYSQIRTPDTELSNMHLIEPERGCHRGCTYCVMRRSTNGGMRLVAPDKVMSLVPSDAKRVGLVGAAVTDHPGLPKILSALVASGREVGISSLRADRLTDEIVGLLRKGGYRTLTTAADGASQRMRDAILRKNGERHLIRAAELARDHGMRTLKLYMMLGLPDENDDDIDELIRFGTELSRIAPSLVFGVAPFVAKRNTPLDGAAFADPRVVSGRLERLQNGLKGRAEIRSTSTRWAWVEYRLAQGGFAAGLAAVEAAKAGGGFAAWKRALKAVPEPPVRTAEPAAPLMKLRATG